VFDGEATYDDLLALLNGATEGPTGILYFPYLSGSGAPKPDPKARGAFIGLAASHQRSDLLKAVLEGTAYQMEAIRRAAERATDSAIAKILAVGGGTRNLHWMQIKADISGCRFDLSPVAEATLLGAAMTAAIGCGLYASAQEAVQAVTNSQEIVSIEPNAKWNEPYQKLYEEGYRTLQEPLRQFARR
jgi:sugar (pentulose or hexulose) kinase